MRPIQTAPIPKRSDGTPKTVSEYQDWRWDLINAYGPHCAYCNCKIPNSIEVEHQIAQAINAVDPLNWDNLVLACKPCNIAKTSHHFAIDTHFIPTYHNTHLAFIYNTREHRKLKGHFACIPIPNPRFPLNSKPYNKSQKTIEDLKLDRVEQISERRKRATDIRWKNRYEVYLETKTTRQLWDSLTTDHQKTMFLEDFKIRVHNKGFFSLWYQTFQDVCEVLEVLIDAFENTHKNSFPKMTQFQPVERIIGDL